MSLASLPTRLDQDLVAGTDTTLEFTIMSGDGPIDISNDTVVVTVMDEEGGAPILAKINPSGQHSDPAHGKSQFTFTDNDTVTGVYSPVRWWYEVRRISGVTQKQRVHIVGEMRLSPSMKLQRTP